MTNSNQKTVLFTGTALPETYRKRLRDHGCTLKMERHDLSEDELIQTLKGVSGYILGGVEKATRRVLESSPELKIVTFFGVGYENYIDCSAATDCGIAVTNTPGSNARSVAEFTITLMLDAVKKSPFLIDATKQGDWKEIQTKTVKGKTLGIVGMGTIGGIVAEIAHKGFGMNILYTGRTPKPELESSLKAQFVPLPELLKRCDVLSLHANVSEHTVGIIGEAELNSMKDGAVLVNTSRAELVDPKALKNALASKKISCAAFDGYYQEPVPKPESDKWGLVGLSHEIFLVSPHTAYFTEDATAAMADLSTNSVMEMLDGHEPSHLVNPEYKVNACKRQTVSSRQ
ncbi:MAG TPA: D-isomer specific 2-hydroxyacid dehydrogenase family protein [Oculatellaceae cyanobacterium]